MAQDRKFTNKIDKVLGQYVPKQQVVISPVKVVSEPEIAPIVEQVETPQQESISEAATLPKADAELVNRLLHAQKLSSLAGVDISVVLQEMAKQPILQKKKTVNFKRDANGVIVGADIVES